MSLTIEAADGHATTGANEGGEGLAVGSDELATLAWVGLLLVEVEDEVLVLGQESKSIGGAAYLN